MPKSEVKELYQNAHGCVRDGDIIGLQMQQKAVQECLERLEGGQGRMVDALEKLAAQGERVGHLEIDRDFDRSENGKKFDNLFKRVGVLEQAPGKAGNDFRRDVGMVVATALLTLCITLILKALGVKP